MVSSLIYPVLQFTSLLHTPEFLSHLFSIQLHLIHAIPFNEYSPSSQALHCLVLALVSSLGITPVQALLLSLYEFSESGNLHTFSFPVFSGL